MYFVQVGTLKDRKVLLNVWLFENIGSDNGLSPNRRQAIIWTNAGSHKAAYE